MFTSKTTFLSIILIICKSATFLQTLWDLPAISEKKINSVLNEHMLIAQWALLLFWFNIISQPKLRLPYWPHKAHMRNNAQCAMWAWPNREIREKVRTYKHMYLCIFSFAVLMNNLSCFPLVHFSPKTTYIYSHLLRIRSDPALLHRIQI